MILETFAVGALACNCTILGDLAGGEAIVIDGGADVPAIASRLERHGLRARYLVHTHAHIDHIGALGPLRERCGGAGLLHPADLPLYRTLGEQARWIGLGAGAVPVALDGDLADGDVLAAGPLRLEVLHTPGHTPGSVSFALADGTRTVVFSGDTLFRGSVGRWDLGGTSLDDIVASIRSRLLVYPDETEVVAGHGPPTTVGAERNANPFLNPMLRGG